MSLRLLSILISLASLCSLHASTHDELMRAMRDEAKRALAELHVESLQKPYYVEYLLTIKNTESVKATLGGTVNTKKGMSAVLTVGIRVGNPTFDNTNFFDVSLGFFGSGDDEESFKNRRIPIELDYPTLRRELWLATDACYKQSAELHAKKEAAIKNRLRTDTTHDFNPLGPAQLRDVSDHGIFNIEQAESLVQELSSHLRNSRTISSSSVSMEHLPETLLYVNTEGREYIKTKHMIGVEVIASGQCQDGMPIAETYTSYARTYAELPAKDSLIKAVKTLATSFEAVYAAQRLSDPYSGPIIMEGQAAHEIIAQIFAPQCIVQRPPLTDRGVQDNDRFTAFQNKIGGRVLPEFLSMIDNPNLQKFDETSLVGHYSIDDEGIPAQMVNVVEKGYLKTLLSGRIPTKRIRSSNGHSRGGAPIYGIMQMMCLDKKKEVEAKAMKSKMMSLCKARELPYGIIIRKALNQNILYTVLYEQTSGEYPFAQGDSKMSVLEAYKIYPDGKEERIRGGELAGISPASFKDIILVGKKSRAYNLLASSVVSSFMTGGSQFISASIITPDLLFEDLEFKPIESDFPKPPLIASPTE
ncbi:MAG: metallopeptidase TldD-related protein [Ignavibacteria bacterium]